MSAAVERWKIIANFACIYLVWGSTYLAIKYAIVGFPPFMMAFLRFSVASSILYVLSFARKESQLKYRDFLIAGLSGTLLVLANAFVCLAEKDLASGLVAVFVGTLPVWIMILNWRLFHGPRPRWRQVLGVVLSLIGVVLLTQAQLVGGQYGSLISWMALSFSVLSWSMGSLIQRTASEKKSLFRFSAIQMGVGAMVMMVLWMLYEGPQSFQWERVTSTSLWALLYLIVFGSVIAFSSYLWLNRHGEPTVVSTYALVNPVIALWLGWLLADEVVTLSTIVWSLLVIIGIYLVVVKKKDE